MELQGDAKLLFFTMMQAALKMSDMGKKKSDFIIFANEIWNTMELNDKDQLFEILQSSMLKDLKDCFNDIPS